MCVGDNIEREKVKFQGFTAVIGKLKVSYFTRKYLLEIDMRRQGLDTPLFVDGGHS